MTEQKVVYIPEVIVVSEFATLLGVSVAKVVGELMRNGVMATINEQIDFDTASIIGAELGFEIEPKPVEAQARPSDSVVAAGSKQHLADRPPVVTVMGHVDHGKTSLLDAIRQSDVVSSEAGGITQHIGAYQVKHAQRTVTFLDTPGHEAFSAIRAHGAKMTDVAIIVVAADDGIKPQTKEAIDLAKTANVPIVVAINKIDKEGADENRIKQQLSEIGLVPDDWGGDVPCVAVSAKQKTGIDKLLDVVLLVADITELKADFDAPASGLVIESHLESGRGAVATILVQQGTVRVGDSIVIGSTYGKVRNLEDYRGDKLKSATPAMPAVVIGLKTVPNFGDWFEVVANEKIAKDWVQKQLRNSSIKSLSGVKGISEADLTRAVEDGQVNELALVVKADVQGSLESLLENLGQLGNDEVRVRIVSSGVGDISENDVNSASASGAVVLGFNVGIKAVVNQLAKRTRVEFELYKVIYELLDDVRGWLSGMLKPETVVIEHARLEILGVFKVHKGVIITGGKVLSGKITPSLKVKFERAGEVVGSGELVGLQKDKQDTRQVDEGEECGLSISSKDTLELGDTVVFYSEEQHARQL